MKWQIGISLVAVGVLGGTARADQCQWVDEAAAAKAQAILASSPKIIAFCEPCGDTVPGIPEVASRVEVVTPEAGYRELYLNGSKRGIDLAYTYVQTSQRQYSNLAALAGCEASDVSPTLEVSEETESGVLITASDRPVAKVRAATPTLTPTQAAAPPSPAVYVYSTTVHEMPWLAIALAVGGGAVSGAMLMLWLVATRRRRAMRPRAVELR
jgi:hypothetical protein